MLEERKVQSQRLVDDLAANTVGELELDQLLHQPPRLIERRAEQEKSQFENQVDKNRFDPFRVSAPLDRSHDSIDDQLTYPGLGRGQQGAAQRENAQTRGGPGVGLPYKFDSLRRM